MEQIKQLINKRMDEKTKEGWKIIASDTDGFFAVKDNEMRFFKFIKDFEIDQHGNIYNIEIKTAEFTITKELEGIFVILKKHMTFDKVKRQCEKSD